jgi:ABC-type tungstate transport system substrate-binding protein
MSGLGHLGVGLAAKRTAPKIPLVILLAAPMLLDIIWAIFSLAGIQSNAWSHGLFMSVIWSLITAILTGFITHNFHASLMIGLLVFSHWVVDFITHPMGFIFPKDTGIPLFFEGSPMVGLGLYNTLGGVIIGEAVLIVPGVILYVLTLRKLRNKSKKPFIGTVEQKL